MKLVLLLMMLSKIVSAVQAQRSCTILADKHPDTLPTEEVSEESSTAADRLRPDPLTSRIRSGLGFVGEMNPELLKTLSTAWQSSGAGALEEERVVLIFKNSNEHYTGKLTPPYRDFRSTSFRWEPSAVAIVHTHPNSAQPQPSDHDQMIARKYAVPMFTITAKGLFVYNPLTKKTTKLFDGIKWLCLSKWTARINTNLNLNAEANRK